jgi:hypothetical protein
VHALDDNQEHEHDHEAAGDYKEEYVTIKQLLEYKDNQEDSEISLKAADIISQGSRHCSFVSGKTLKMTPRMKSLSN